MAMAAKIATAIGPKYRTNESASKEGLKQRSMISIVSAARTTKDPIRTPTIVRFISRAIIHNALEQFRREEIVQCLAAADEAGAIAFDQDLGGTDARVVVRAEAHAVGAGVEQGDEIA